MTTNIDKDYIAKLAEYDALPDDLMTRILWTNQNPPPRVRLVCCECGQLYRLLQLAWDEVEREFRLHGGTVMEEIKGLCPKHEELEDEKEKEKEEE